MHRRHCVLELDQSAVARRADDAPAEGLDLRSPEFVAMGLHGGQRRRLVRREQPVVAGHIGGDDRRQSVHRAIPSHERPLPNGLRGHSSMIRAYGCVVYKGAGLEGRIGMEATLGYMAASAEPSLYRNGKVLTVRDGDGSDSGRRGVDLDPRRMPIADARRLAADARPTLRRNGFELLDAPLATADIDFLDSAAVLRDYYDGCAEIVREASGAGLVVAFDHNVRSASGKRDQQRIAGGQQVQGPAQVVHGDYTLTSAVQRLRDLAAPPTANDTYRPLLAEGETLLDPAAVEHALHGGRFALVNLWRNIADAPVANHHLALCDAVGVRPDDLVVFEIHYADRVGENYFARHADSHRWYVYPGLTRDEALLIKQWDSDGPMALSQGARADGGAPDQPCTFSVHTAFEDPTAPADAPDRWSIEVRCAALYD